ncbi:hypothetical protein D3C78_1049080 [compost metagenome]
MHAREIVRINDILGLGFHNRLLVTFGSARFLSGDEGGADIGHVSTHGLRGENGAAIGDGAGQQQRAVEPLADFLNEGEGRKCARMSAGTRRDRNQPIRTLADGRAGMAVVDDVM